MSISKEAIGKILQSNEADTIYDVAKTALAGLHKLVNMTIDARKNCQSVNDYEDKLREMHTTINGYLFDVDVALNIIGTPEPDTTDLTQDEQAVSIVSPNRAA